MKFFYFVVLIYVFLIYFFPIRSYFNVQQISSFDKKVVYSTNSFFTDQVKIPNCFDRNLYTSCKEFFKTKSINDSQENLIIHPKETAFVIELSPTHNLSEFPPKENQLLEFWIYFNEEDLKFHIPKKVVLIFYEQKLYHINKDYRFPDQPVKSFVFTVLIEKKLGWQKFTLPKRKILKSGGFPENIYQRWVKLIIEEIHKNHPSDTISIGEIFFRDEFYYEKF
ncbi:MAG: hypothetical protein ACK4UJ_05755 [Leptonema sp. (in: bacteria)]